MICFKEKAKNYTSVSSMIRDAVMKLNNNETKNKHEIITDLSVLYKKHNIELSHLSGNFNQAMKRANELSIENNLKIEFFKKILFPQVNNILNILHKIQKEQNIIIRKIMERSPKQTRLSLRLKQHSHQGNRLIQTQ